MEYVNPFETEFQIEKSNFAQKTVKKCFENRVQISLELHKRKWERLKVLKHHLFQSMIASIDFDSNVKFRC